MKFGPVILAACAVLLLLSSSAAVFAQSVLSKAERTSESLEPTLVHSGQEAAAQAKLDALLARAGKRPNIVWLVVDDMGYGDPGAYGGGAAIGAATPNMDRLAREGLKLTSTYSQPTCTPTRSAMLTGRLPVQNGPNPADTGRRQAHQESVGGRNLPPKTAR